MAYVSGDDYVKLDAISDVGNQRINRIELRSEVAGAVQNPQENVTVSEAQAAGDIWLRLTKAGTNYTGEYSFDGTTWTAFPGGAVANPMADPDFGLFAFAPQASGVGETVSFDYFTLDGQDPPSGCECVAGPGDEFDGAALDKTKWNAIVREDDTNYEVVRRRAADHHGRRRHLHQRRSGLDPQLHPAAGPGRRLGDRDEGLGRHERRLRARRPDGPPGRRQLHQVRRHLRREPDDQEPDRAPVGGRRRDPGPAAAGDEAGTGLRGRLAAPDQDRHDLLGRVLRGRRDVDVRRRIGRQRGDHGARRSASSPWVSTARAPPSCSTTSPSTAARAASRRRRRTTRRRSGTSRRRRPSARARCR